MRLETLLSEVEIVDRRGNLAGVDVVDLTHDSTRVAPGWLFCCLRGARVDGHDFAATAVERGAVALLVERLLDVAAPQAVVRDARRAMALAAAALHGHPSRKLTMIGVTGTNGKTTTVALTRSVLEAAGRQTETLGTLQPASAAGPPNTPDPPDLHRRLAEFADRGIDAVAMEVSSHSLAHNRVDGIRFRVAAFTNLTQDHLDFHGSMEDYFGAKARLFEEDMSDVAVVNIDDPYGVRLGETTTIPVVPYSLSDVSDVEMESGASRFTWRGHRVTIPLAGRFNVSNAVCALTIARELGVADEDAAFGLSAAPPIRGRVESVDAGQPFAVIVDYAHTPDGLEKLLEATREAAGDGRLIVVFGCGGDKDRDKRPKMGAIAARLADRVIVTSDNPRSEDPVAIIGEIVAGVAGDDVDVEVDRRAAIRLAIREAQPGDTVVIAGKGHETGQEIAGRVLPFDDRDVALAELSSGGAS